MTTQLDGIEFSKEKRRLRQDGRDAEGYSVA